MVLLGRVGLWLGLGLELVLLFTLYFVLSYLVDGATGGYCMAGHVNSRGTAFIDTTGRLTALQFCYSHGRPCE